MSAAGRALVVSDTHFGHRLMASIRPWPTIEEHDDEIVRRWNDAVGKHDTVWHLGDLVFNRRNLSILSRLKGRIRLVLGNHDLLRPREYLDAGIVTLHGAAVARGDVILTHVPVHPCQVGLGRRFRGNVHGHMHDHRVKVERRHPFSGFPGLTSEDTRYRCVSLEQTDYRPILLDEAIAGF